jgi:hypothetical protein
MIKSFTCPLSMKNGTIWVPAFKMPEKMDLMNKIPISFNFR